MVVFLVVAVTADSADLVALDTGLVLTALSGGPDGTHLRWVAWTEAVLTVPACGAGSNPYGLAWRREATSQLQSSQIRTNSATDNRQAAAAAFPERERERERDATIGPRVHAEHCGAQGATHSGAVHSFIVRGPAPPRPWPNGTDARDGPQGGRCSPPRRAWGKRAAATIEGCLARTACRRLNR